MTGVGLGIAFANGGNSGGTDIIALVVSHYRNISPGRVILYLDVIIIASSYILFRSVEKLVYGYVVIGCYFLYFGFSTGGTETVFPNFGVFAKQSTNS